jgi:hypothetical protein
MKATTQKLLLFIAAIGLSITAKASPLAQKEWTFLLFLNGHNNLASYSDMNIKDMEKAGSTDQVNLVVEWGKEGDPATKRLLIQKSTDPSQVTSPVIESHDNVDMGDYHSLVDFVKWGADNFPAKHYFVAVWNHGSGWHFQQAKANGDTVSINDISYDDDSGNHITTEQLGQAMSDIKQYLGRNVDIYGSDACLMSMIEVAAEMKDSVDYFVGSQETEPGEGWPYAPFMEKWTSQPQGTPAEVSTWLSKEYLKSYSPGGVYGTQSITFSALDLSKLDAVIDSSAKVAAHLKSLSAADLKKVKSSVNRVQDFYYSDYKDYGDLLKTIKALPIQKDTKLIDQATADLKALVVSTDSSASYAKSTGLSIWVPSSASSSYMERYKGLAYDKAAHWSDMLVKLLK